MPVIKPTCVRDVKMRVNLGDVISRVVTLRKAGGARLKGLCPFHNEKTPSFHVDPDKGFYKCFGCGKAGDAITFVRETEQLNFSEAVEALGQRFNIVIEYEEGSGGPSREERSLRQEIFDLHDAAAEHFYQAFKAPDATGGFFQKYWTEQRRFTMELADEFKIGAVDAHGSALGALLMRKKFSEEALRRCGLFFIYDDAPITLGALRARFRGRLMIPIRDHQGRVVAFTARQSDLTPPDDPAREAKYVNSPETPVFTKGNLLFNLDRARTNVGEGKPFVLVEGQLDALRCWSVGLKTAIAPQGTSITEGQLVLLRRYHPQVECFFDSDVAGQKAALRFLPMAVKAGLEVRFLTLAGAEKLDPDLLFLERGLAGYEEVRRGAQSAMAFACRAALPDPLSASPELKARAAQSIFDIIVATESEITRAELLVEAGGHLRTSTLALQKDFASFVQRLNRQISGRPTIAPIQPNSPSASYPSNMGGHAPTGEHQLLYLSLHFPDLGKAIAHTLPHEWIDRSSVTGILLDRLLNELEHDTWTGNGDLESLTQTEEEKSLVAALLFEVPTVGYSYMDIADPKKLAVMGIEKIRGQRLEPEINQLALALSNPSPDSNDDLPSLLERHRLLRKQLSTPIDLNLLSN